MSIMRDVPLDVEGELLGHVGGITESWRPDLGHGFAASGYEDNPELTFPRAQAVWDLMRRTDGKIGALIRAINGPILDNQLSLKPIHTSRPVDPAVERFVAEQIGLDGESLTVTATGFKLAEHRRDALLALPLGFAPFVPVYAPNGTTGRIDLYAVEPRLARTVQEVRVNRNGTLAGIIQAGIGWDPTGHGAGVSIIGGPGPVNDSLETFIPADQLAYYCFEREGGNWLGSSILRTSYKHWLVRDQLIRLDGASGERNGMGLPVVYYSEDGDRATALKIAREARAGATAGLALEDGKYRFDLAAVKGTVRDLLPSIEYHDRMIGQSALAMFLELGHAGGLGGNSGLLASVFRDLFVDQLNAVDRWLCDTFTHEVIRPLVAHNFGTDTAYPALVPDKIAAEATPTADALKSLADAGLITADHALEVDLRRRYRLPEPGDQVVGVPGRSVAPEDLHPTAPGAPAGLAAGDDSATIVRATALLQRLLDLQAAPSGQA